VIEDRDPDERIDAVEMILKQRGGHAVVSPPRPPSLEILEPEPRFELGTSCLQDRCSTS
jgi:hypothetical protein